MYQDLQSHFETVQTVIGHIFEGTPQHTSCALFRKHASGHLAGCQMAPDSCRQNGTITNSLVSKHGTEINRLSHAEQQHTTYDIKPAM